MRRIVCLIAFLLFVRAAAAAGPADELTIGLSQYPSTLHPNIESMLAKTYVLGMARRPLTAYGPDWKLACLLCAQLPSFENGLAVREKSPEGKPGVALTVKIRPEAKWGDGTPVSSADAVFTWEVGRHPKTGVASQETYRAIWKIEATDDKTFVLHMDKLTFDYNALNDFGILPAHLERERFAADPAEYKVRNRYDSDPTNPGLYNGPYRIAQVERGSHIVLTPNTHWWGAPPHFKRIVLRVVENTAALEANLLSGSLSMIAGELGLTMDQAVAFEKRHGAKFNVIFKPGLVYEHIDLNLDNPILKSLEVRRALALALDREALVKSLFDGRQPVAHSMVSPLDRMFAGDLPPLAHDLATAQALLDAAGWKPGKDGVRANGAGERLSLELITTAGNRSRELVAQALQSQWRKAGVEIRIKLQPARVMFGDSTTKRQFTGLAMYAWISAPDSVPRSSLHSTHIPKADNNWSGQNYPGYANPEADRLIDAIEIELDEAKRKALWRQLQEIYRADLPVIPLYFRADPYILPKNLKGLVPTGHQDPSTLWIENWRME